MLDRSVEYLLFRIVEISCPSRGSDCRIILVYELVFQLSIKSESCFLVFGRKNLRSRCVWKRQLRKKLCRSPYSEICRWLTALRSKSLQPLACVFSCCASNTGNKSLFFHAASIVWRFCQVTSEKRCWVINKQARWRQRSANDHERRVTCVPGMMARGGGRAGFIFSVITTGACYLTRGLLRIKTAKTSHVVLRGGFVVALLMRRSRVAEPES